MLTLGQTTSIPVVSKVPTIILGMGALFGFPEQSNVPSIAAMILSSKPVSDKVDDGIMKEALLDFYTIIEACKFLDEKWNPKDCGYCCTKNHHTKFFQQGSPDNVLHGTVIDNKLHSWGQFMKIRDASETSSSHGGMYAPGVISVPQLFRLKDKVSNFILVY
ncbi:hypothetical protein GOBAR_AA33521 [Gossypium barbadense]|uniref:Piwi domain-containing protein n=1 Tax=Gossypium barbadense TaxID=3634 RepID=A0A2P5W7W2_GOSBA|nr:hypothetical protein GOBAR_AA33521 [Gossypium barbadense]